jgi:hypothetical protein
MRGDDPVHVLYRSTGKYSRWSTKFDLASAAHGYCHRCAVDLCVRRDLALMAAGRALVVEPGGGGRGRLAITPYQYMATFVTMSIFENALSIVAVAVRPSHVQ